MRPRSYGTEKHGGPRVLPALTVVALYQIHSITRAQLATAVSSYASESAYRKKCGTEAPEKAVRRRVRRVTPWRQPSSGFVVLVVPGKFTLYRPRFCDYSYWPRTVGLSLSDP